MSLPTHVPTNTPPPTTNPRPDFTSPKHDPQQLLKVLIYAAKGWLRGFIIGFGVKAAIAFVLSIALRYNRLHRMKLSQFVNLLVTDPAQFGAFLGTLVGSFKLVEGALDWVRGKQSPVHSFVAGGVSGLSLLLDNKSRRAELSLYLLARAMAAITSSLVSKGVLPYIEHFDTMAFSAVCAVIMTIFFYEDINFPRSYVNFFRKMEGSHSEVSARARRLSKHYRPFW